VLALPACSGNRLIVPVSGGTFGTTPVFEAAAARYSWLNDAVSVGVYQPVPGKVRYRVYQIL